MPSEDTQFKPGNKASKGGVRGPRFTTRLLRYIKENGHKNDITTAWLGAALGDEKLLNGRKPNFQFFKEMLDRAEGKIPDPEPAKQDAAEIVKELIALDDSSKNDSGGTEAVQK